MRYAADLHIHSRYASAVSKDMTVDNIALWATRKGINLIGTGDCLQADWLRDLEEKLSPAEPGWFQPKSGPTDLRFVLSTEVSCAPPPGGPLRGIHHLIYFSSFESARSFRNRIASYGDLAEGRPELTLSSRQLLELVIEHGDDCHMAPAHVMNPYFSSLGSREQHTSLTELFGNLQPHLLAVETGLTSIPPMCRRISSLDNHALFSCSDAHSLDNIGREFTLLDIEPGYAHLFSAIREGKILHLFKFPLLSTRYYLNYCSRCKKASEGKRCPICNGSLVTGSRDWLEKIADRPAPPQSQPFQTLLPLKTLLSRNFGLRSKSQKVTNAYEQLIRKIGSERYILTAAREELSGLAIGEAILDQRTVGKQSFTTTTKGSPPKTEQLSLLGPTEPADQAGSMDEDLAA